MPVSRNDSTMGKWCKAIVFWVWVLGLPYSYGYFKDFRTSNGHRWAYRDVPVCYFFTAMWPISIPFFEIINKVEKDAGVY